MQHLLAPTALPPRLDAAVRKQPHESNIIIILLLSTVHYTVQLQLSGHLGPQGLMLVYIQDK